MKCEADSDGLITPRCPYCAVGPEFRPMRLLNSGVYVCACGHRAKPERQEFRCSCAHCQRARRQVALLADLPPSSIPIGSTRQTEILHCLNLVTLGKVMTNMEKDDPTETTAEPEAGTRAIEIQKELVILYEQQKAFAHPTPSEAPHEYEPEELESWGELKTRIQALEAELAEMKPRALGLVRRAGGREV